MSGLFSHVTDYQTMSLDQIKSLQVPIADNAILFLWTIVTNSIQSICSINKTLFGKRDK